MEAHGCREFAADSRRGRFVRLALEAAVLDCIVPRFVAQLATPGMRRAPVTRDMAGRAMTYLHARTHYGVVKPAALAPLSADLARGPRRRRPHGARRPLRPADLGPRRRERAAVGVGARATATSSARPTRRPERGGVTARTRLRGPRRGQRSGRRRAPTAATTTVAPTSARSRTPSSARASGRAPGSCSSSTRTSTWRPRSSRRPGEAGRPTHARAPAPARRAAACPTAASTARRSPTRSTRRKRIAQRLLRARTLGQRRIDKRTPGGRFDGRAYARRRFERATGRPASSHPWTITREITAPLEEPHALLVVDTSGSMAAHEYALGPIVWIVTTAFRAIGGKVATVLFGNAAALLSDGTEPMANVPAIRVGGGTAFAGDAIVDRRRPSRDGQPPPPARRLHRLRRRLVRHRGRRRRRSAGSPSSAYPRSTSRSAPSRCRSRPAASASSPTPPTAWT